MKLIINTQQRLVFVLVVLISSVLSASWTKRSVHPRDWDCLNSPTSRACWANGFDLYTDSDTIWPNTGYTMTYEWEITNSTCSPDGGVERTCFRINGQYPGPVLHASWGDTVVVNVKNSLTDNGTSIHWHGVRQYNTVGMDGTPGITECPIAPGQTRTYRFVVTQYGTSWYHSHWSAQYDDGIVGPIVFEGQASADYDLDLGPYTITEWYYLTTWQVNALSVDAQQGRGLPPHAGTILINGTDQSASGTGKYDQVVLTPGLRHRLRLVNIGTDNYVRVSLDDHVMQVITSDFVPIKPYYTETVLIGPGQRYDVVINATQTPSNYWFRAHVAPSCGSTNEHNGSAIWTYGGETPDTPSSTPFDIPYDCIEPTNLAPIRKQPVPQKTANNAFKDLDVNTTKSVVIPGGHSMVVWALNTTDINVDWAMPTLGYVFDGNTSYPDNLAIQTTEDEGLWNYWVLQQLPSMPPVPHPIHLHGHDYYVLGQGFGQFDLTTANLNYDTPPRRDSASVNGAGWLAIAFLSNNPGKSEARFPLTIATLADEY